MRDKIKIVKQRFINFPCECGRLGIVIERDKVEAYPQHDGKKHTASVKLDDFDRRRLASAGEEELKALREKIDAALSMRGVRIAA